MASLKILVAGDPGSIHANRFVALLKEIGYEVRMFQSEEQYWLEEHLRDTVVYVASFDAPPINGNLLKATYPCELSFTPLLRFIHLSRKPIAALLGLKLKVRPRSDALARIVRRWCPDIVFSLKMQNDGYTVAAAREMMEKQFKAKWVHFSWGTDMEFFGKHPEFVIEHLPKIRRLLSLCDFHMADTDRDVRQAREFGFKGIDLGAMLAHGGFALHYMRKIMQEAGDKRDVILVKGREGGLVGKAFNVLAALHRIPHLVKNYRVKIIMPSEDMRGAARFLSRLDGINYEIMPRLSYAELLKLFARSRIAISASDVDGTPSFLVEAMCMGALPVHSDMVSVREWVTEGENGLLFPVDDVGALVSCIERGLADDRLVEQARLRNWEIAAERMDRNKIRAHLKYLIEERVLAERSSAGSCRT